MESQLSLMKTLNNNHFLTLTVTGTQMIADGLFEVERKAETEGRK